MYPIKIEITTMFIINIEIMLFKLYIVKRPNIKLTLSITTFNDSFACLNDNCNTEIGNI